MPRLGEELKALKYFLSHPRRASSTKRAKLGAEEDVIASAPEDMRTRLRDLLASRRDEKKRRKRRKTKAQMQQEAHRKGKKALVIG